MFKKTAEIVLKASFILQWITSQNISVQQAFPVSLERALNIEVKALSAKKALCSCKELKIILHILNCFCRTVNTQIKPCLDKLKVDSDIDVCHFAYEAIDG